MRAQTIQTNTTMINHLQASTQSINKLNWTPSQRKGIKTNSHKFKQSAAHNINHQKNKNKLVIRIYPQMHSS